MESVPSFLLNFGEAFMKDGIHRIINGTIE